MMLRRSFDETRRYSFCHSTHADFPIRLPMRVRERLAAQSGDTGRKRSGKRAQCSADPDQTDPDQGNDNNKGNINDHHQVNHI